MGIIQDITKRKQSELALQASEQKFSSLFMHMAEGVAIHELTYDAKGNPEDYLIVNTNPSFETHLGIPKDAVILKTSKEAYGVSEPPYFDIYSHVAMTGEPYRFETFFPPLNKHFAISVYCPVKGSFATIFEDITTRKQAEKECEDLIAELEKTNEKLGAAYEELSGSEEELRHQYETLAHTEESLRKSTDLLENLIAIANVPIIIWDPSFHIIRMNHAFETLIGRSSDEVIGRSLEFLFPPDQAERSMRLFLTTMEGVRWETVEIDIQHKDGSIRTLLWNSATLYTPDGLKPVASIAQGHDISGERRLEQEKDAALLQIQQNLSYLAILNDEIRNPLMIILTLADMLDDEKVFTEINLQARRIDAMVSQLDKRWIESEKVLNAIRKHYQIQAAKPEQNTNSISKNAPVSNQKFLIEEVQAQLYTILDSIDALVYVADMDSYEVLFINKKGRSWFGDPAGLKCYQYLQKDPDGPCPYCTNHLLVDEFGPTGVKHGEYQNTRTGWWFDCRDRAIRWSDGRLVKLGIATDITQRRQAEEALREKTEELDQYFSTCLDLFSIADTDGYFRHLNPEWEKTLGYQLDELEGSRFLDYVHPDDVPATLATLADLGNKNEVLNFTNRYRHKNGTYRWIEWRASPSPLNNKIYASARDITERKLAEEALLESKRRYVNLYRYAQVGLFETSLKEGTVVACNERYAALAGFSSIEEAIGQDIIHLYVNPEDRKEISRILHEEGHIDDYILQLKKHQTEQPFWAQFSARINLAEDIAEGTIIDITELKQVEQALRESEAQFRSYIDKSPEGTFLASEKGELLFMNAAGCTMTGFSLAELLKKNLADIIHPDDRDRAREHFLQVVHEGNSSGEFRFITHNGDIRSWVVYVFRLSQTRILGFTRDITEQKQAEEALRESNRKLRLLTGLTRHDIYNHISAIQILLEMALSSSDLTKIHTYITRTQEAGSKIEATIGFTREYENFGIVSSGWQKVHPIIESAKMEISLHDVTIDNLVPQDIDVYADPIIRKVFATLMDNAVRHGGDITHIRFLCHESIHELLIICENDGESIPQKDKDRIFDQGFGKNTGIGLFISKEILSITGLSIRECGAEGEGVRFEISVPEGKFRRTGLTNPLKYEP
jgi:PAS domain S-box-containing protein